MTSPRQVFPSSVHQKIFAHLKKTKRLALSGLGNTSAKSFLVADLAQNFPTDNILWVINNDEEFKIATKAIGFWEPESVHIWDNKISEDDYNEEQNLTTLSKLYGQEVRPPRIIITNRDGFLSDFPSKAELERKSLHLECGIKIENFELINFLIENGYKLNPDNILNRGEYSQEGGVIRVFPQNSPTPLKLEFLGDSLEEIYLFDQAKKNIVGKLPAFALWPNKLFGRDGDIAEHLPTNTILVQDELDIDDADTYDCDQIIAKCKKCKNVIFTAFPDDDDEDFFHLKYLSLLRFHNFYDLVNDLKEKKHEGWQCLISTRRIDELKNILGEENISYSTDQEESAQIHLLDANQHEAVPHSFQNTQYKIELLTDKEIFQLKKRSLTDTQKKVYLDFLGKLKMGDYVVHIDQGIGMFLGSEKREIDGITREYLKLGYAAGDKLYVPIDQAEKVNKYIGQEDRPPRITRLGSAEWNTITSKVRIETEKIAGELLELYAARQAQKGYKFGAIVLVAIL